MQRQRKKSCNNKNFSINISLQTLSICPAAYRPEHIGVSPSGKASAFGADIRWFESSHPSQKCPNLLKLGHIFSIFCVFLLIFRDETHLWDTRDGESSCPKIPIFFVEIQAITSALSFPLTYIPSLELNTYAGACIPITTKKLWTKLQKCYTQLKDV